MSGVMGRRLLMGGGRLRPRTAAKIVSRQAMAMRDERADMTLWRSVAAAHVRALCVCAAPAQHACLACAQRHRLGRCGARIFAPPFLAGLHINNAHGTIARFARSATHIRMG